MSSPAQTAQAAAETARDLALQYKNDAQTAKLAAETAQAAAELSQQSISSSENIQAGNPSGLDYATAWQFQGSNDNANWTTIDTQSNQLFNDLEVKTYDNLTNLIAYRYYRFNVTANNGGPNVGFVEIELMENLTLNVTNEYVSAIDSFSQKENTFHGRILRALA